MRKALPFLILAGLVLVAGGALAALDPAAAVALLHGAAPAAGLTLASLPGIGLARRADIKSAQDIMNMDTHDVKSLMIEAVDEFAAARKAHEAKLERMEAALEEMGLKAGRAPMAGLLGSGGSKAADPQERKHLDAGFRALVRGDTAKANEHFREAKAMSVSSDPEGGYLVHPTFSTEMTKIMLEVAPFIGEARTINLEQGDSFEEPIDDGEAGAEWVGETQTRGETASPAIAMFTCPVHEIQAEPKVTQKLIDTAGFDVTGWLQAKVAEKFALKEVDAFFNGDGVARPRGFLTLPTATTTDATRARGTLQYIPTGTSGAFGSGKADCLIDTVSELKPQFRGNAKWMMNRRTLGALKKLKEATSDQYIWQPGLQAGQPDRLLGYPVIEAEQMPDISAGSMSIAFGDFRKGYTIVRRLGVRFLLDPYTQKPFVKLYSYTRVGGGVNNSQAIKLVKFAAT